MKQVKKIKFHHTIEDMNKIQGGYGNCWCTCNCMEASITGFSLGMMSGVSAGELENPKCSGIIASLFDM